MIDEVSRDIGPVDVLINNAGILLRDSFGEIDYDAMAEQYRVNTLGPLRVTEALAIPTIGIGAGRHVDGQVLVLQDLLGVSTSYRPKFVRTWMDGSTLIRDALQAYHRDVTSRAFPNGEESYR